MKTSKFTFATDNGIPTLDFDLIKFYYPASQSPGNPAVTFSSDTLTINCGRSGSPGMGEQFNKFLSEGRDDEGRSGLS